MQDFISAIQASGLVPPSSIIPDGKIHRFSSSGKPKDNSGWYIYFDGDIPGGSFGCWRELPAQTWHKNIGRELTDQERQEYKQRMHQAAELREQERQAAEIECERISRELWAASPAASPDHPYLVKKRCKAFKLRQSGDTLLVPMYRGKNDLASLQRIYPDGGKFFNEGTQLAQGLYTGIGDKLTHHIILCEGWATGASLHEATGLTVIVAFNAGNLPKVAELMRERYPTHQFIVAADNDQFTTRQDGSPWNPGIDYGQKAAHILGAKLVYPEFENLDTKPTDFNDLYLLESLSAVKRQVTESVTPALQPLKPAPEYTEAFDLFTKIQVPEISRDMLPEPIADFAYDQGELIGVHPGMIALPCIVACAAALHDGITIQPKQLDASWTESARLWLALVGDPSIKKTSSLSKAVRPIKNINMNMFEENKRTTANYIREKDQWKIQCVNAKQSGLDNPPEPEPPEIKCMVVEDITVEKLSHVLKDNPRGVISIQDELSGWFGSMNAYGNGKSQGKDESKWLQLYNGGSMTVSRVTSQSIYVPNWSSSMVGAIQPEIIKGIASRISSDGLLQRFIVIIGANQEEQDRIENLKAKQEYQDIIDRLYSISPDPQAVKISAAGHEVRKSLYRYIAEMTQFESLPTSFKTHLNKWQGLFPRILLVYHCIECTQNGQYPNQVEVSETTCKRVAKLMMKYLLPNAASFYIDMLSSGTYMDDLKWIAGHILSKNLAQISSRDITIAYRVWRDRKEWERRRILTSLEEFGWIFPRKDKESAWEVNPYVHTQFANKAEKEKESRQRVKEAMIRLKIAETSSEFD